METTTNYWWVCPECGRQNSSVAHDEEGEIIGAALSCKGCFYIRKGKEKTFVDERVYEIPQKDVEKLQKNFWFCKGCRGLNDISTLSKHLTVDDLSCIHCGFEQSEFNTLSGETIRNTSNLSKNVLERSKLLLPLNKKVFVIGVALVLSSSLGLGIWDGIRTRETFGVISDPQSQTTISIEEYKIVTRSGWVLPTNASDFELVSKDYRYKETIEVEAGVETYTISEAKEVCDRVEVGATSTVRCRNVPAVTGTRTIYRDEVVYDWFYTWKQGVWELKTNLVENSSSFELKIPDTSMFQGQEDIRINEPDSSCSVGVNFEDKKISQRERINCDIFVNLEEGDSGQITFSRWFGIKEIEIYD